MSVVIGCGPRAGKVADTLTVGVGKMLASEDLRCLPGEVAAFFERHRASLPRLLTLMLRSYLDVPVDIGMSLLTASSSTHAGILTVGSDTVD